MRMIVPVLLLSLCFCMPSTAQIVVLPSCSFEKLTWGDSLEYVKQQLRGKTFIAPRDTVNREHIRMYSYHDTVDSKKVRITLSFADEGHRLFMISLFYFGLSEDSAEADTSVQRSAAELWDWFTERYGPLHTDKNLPSLGQARLWRFWGTTVQMIKLHGPTEGLTVTYSQMEIKESR